MQFYILDADPVKSAKLLPDYALKKVNLREGWQILSDIGHIHGVTWEGQNKLYSASHAKTLSLCQDLESFDSFCDHYEACHQEYRSRFGKNGPYWDKWKNFDGSWEYRDLIICLANTNKCRQTAKYLLNNKRKHLTEEEIKRLMKI